MSDLFYLTTEQLERLAAISLCHMVLPVLMIAKSSAA